MSEELKPALSAEEWAGEPPYLVAKVESTSPGIWLLDWGKSGRVLRVRNDDETEFDCTDGAALMAIANHALPDSDPRKITRADIEPLIRAAGDIRPLGFADDAQALCELYAKLESLLPPETP